MSWNKFFYLPRDTPDLELESRIRVDIPIDDIMKIMCRTQQYLFSKSELDIVDYYQPGNKTQKFRIISLRSTSPEGRVPAVFKLEHVEGL